MSVRLFVLGLVAQRDIHGYEIKSTARLWGVERWARMHEGSIYHALAHLKKERLIEERAVEVSKNNQLRTIYSITEQGRIAFLDLLRETACSAGTEGRDIDFALAFLDFLPPEERLFLLEERHALLLSAHAHTRAAFRDLTQYPDLHPWVALGMRHSLARIEAEIAWNRAAREEVGGWPQAKKPPKPARCPPIM